jgi:DNA-directed RNA polymerase specialized sigma24 family protein
MTETQMTESDGQLTPGQAKNRAAGLYRLAFLLTGDRARSLDVTLEAIDSGYGTESFFSSWILAWSQRLVIAKALAGIREELAVSARRTASLRIERLALPSRNLFVNPDADGAGGHIENALLSIDVFPRCALLLTVFEGMSAEDAAILLDVDLDSVRKARIIGLRELTRNVVRMRGWTYTASQSSVKKRELTTCLKKRCMISSN